MYVYKMISSKMGIHVPPTQIKKQNKYLPLSLSY